MPYPHGSYWSNTVSNSNSSVYTSYTTDYGPYIAQLQQQVQDLTQRLAGATAALNELTPEMMRGRHMTDMLDEGPAQIIKDLATEAAGGMELEIGQIYAWRDRLGDVKMVDLTDDEHMGMPKRKSGTVRVDDVASFAHYWKKHHENGHSEIFAQPADLRVTGVINAHAAGQPHWQDFRVQMTLTYTDEWLAWTSHNQKPMTQETLATFLDDHIGDIAPGKDVSAARLIELCEQFNATKQVSFSSGHHQKSGATNITYVETIEATGATKTGTVTIPDFFHIRLRPFEDAEPVEIAARLRYRIANKSLTLHYVLDNPAKVAKDAFKAIIGKVEEETGDVVMLGRPS